MLRLDIRMRPEVKRKLQEVADAMGVTISEAVRRLVDEAHGQLVARRRRQAAERLAGMGLDEPGLPDRVSRELDAAHDPGLR